MTRYIVSLLAIFLFSLTTFSQEETDCLSLEDRDGVLYENNKAFKGICYIRDAEGNPISKTTYDRGLPNGEQINWYSNGNIKEIVYYVDYYRDGYAKFFYENGFLKKEGEYVNCVEEGKWIYYYPNGKVEHIEFWKDGEKTGTWQYFDKDGLLIKKEDFN